MINKFLEKFVLINKNKYRNYCYKHQLLLFILHTSLTLINRVSGRDFIIQI